MVEDMWQVHVLFGGSSAGGTERTCNAHRAPRRRRAPRFMVEWGGKRDRQRARSRGWWSALSESNEKFTTSHPMTTHRGLPY